MEHDKNSDKGVIHVYTGHGKGKTTASLGVALRAAGHGMKTVMVQFIKGSMCCGELDGYRNIPGFELHACGKGFVGGVSDKVPLEEHKKAAEDALETAKKKMLSGKFDIIILDELNVALSLNLLRLEDAINFIKEKPENMHMIITGRNAHQKIMEMADLATEMKLVKHYFNNGRAAVKGIGY